MKKLSLMLIISSILSFAAKANPHVVELSVLDYKNLLPITGICQMNYQNGNLSPMGGTQLCIGNQVGTRAYYRLFGTPNKNYLISVKTRSPQGDGLTFEPIGKIESHLNDIDIVPNFNHTVPSGPSGIIDIYYGGNLYLAQEFTPDTSHTVELTGGITWIELP